MMGREQRHGPPVLSRAVPDLTRGIGGNLPNVQGLSSPPTCAPLHLSDGVQLNPGFDDSLGPGSSSPCNLPPSSAKAPSSKKPSLNFHTPGSASPFEKGPFSPP